MPLHCRSLLINFFTLIKANRPRYFSRGRFHVELKPTVLRCFSYPPTKRRRGKCVCEMVDLENSTVHSVTHWSLMYLSSSYSVDSLCQRMHIYLLFHHSVLLTDYVMVLVRIVPKIMLMFLACTVRAGWLDTCLAFSLLGDCKLCFCAFHRRLSSYLS